MDEGPGKNFLHAPDGFDARRGFPFRSRKQTKPRKRVQRLETSVTPTGMGVGIAAQMAAITVMPPCADYPPICLRSHRLKPNATSPCQDPSGPLLATRNSEPACFAPDTAGVISRGVTRKFPVHLRGRGNGRRGQAALRCEDRNSYVCDKCGNERGSSVAAVKVRLGRAIWRGECHRIRRLGKREQFPSESPSRETGQYSSRVMWWFIEGLPVRKASRLFSPSRVSKALRTAYVRPATMPNSLALCSVSASFAVWTSLKDEYYGLPVRSRHER